MSSADNCVANGSDRISTSDNAGINETISAISLKERNKGNVEHESLWKKL